MLFGKNKIKFGQKFFASQKICTHIHLWSHDPNFGRDPLFADPCSKQTCTCLTFDSPSLHKVGKWLWFCENEATIDYHHGSAVK